jgi:glyoxylase-like metal-dependent hydrolase (beta-lactamase superfamily II)
LPTPTLPPATTTNHYVVGQRRAVLVDPSTPLRTAQDRLCELLAELHRSGWRLEGLLLTHHHDDHTGAAAVLAQRLELPILAHARTAERLQGRVRIDRLVQDSDIVAEDADGSVWRALFTPGHAPGHIALVHDVNKAVVAGDMVAGEGTILIDPRDGNMGQYLASLQKLAALEPLLLAPAHGPVIADALGTLRHYHAHRLEREGKVLAALPPTPTDPDALLPAAYGDVARLVWPIALRSLLAHLEHLQEQGLAVRVDDQWRRGAT